jgi:regulator of chromosome condensation
MDVGLKASFVAAGIDNSLAINEHGNLLAWGFSESYRTGLGTDDSIHVPTLLKIKGSSGLRFVFVGCGGQFSVAAALPDPDPQP